MNKILCPVCGNEVLNESRVFEVLKESFGGQTKISLRKFKCSYCDTEFDSALENDKNIKVAMDDLKMKSINNILNDFNDINVSMASIERVLSIPQRTLTKWKTGKAKPSATAFSLFKYLRTFPWLLEVAENNFDYNIAQKIHIGDAIKNLLSTMNFDSCNMSEIGVLNCANSTINYNKYDLKPDMEITSITGDHISYSEKIVSITPIN
jgi:DNA-binding transcriptional regulator YiaG